MWGSLRDLLAATGGAKRDQDRAAEVRLGRLWISLVRLGVARGLVLADAEDLAQESVVAAIDSFDPSRGDFEHFCRTIMVNKTNSLHRATRARGASVEADGLVDPQPGPDKPLLQRQRDEAADRMLAQVLGSLDEEETAFFLLLAEVYEERRYGEVTEAACRAGITPEQGWNLFRKIQRRFKVSDRKATPPRQPEPAEPGVRESRMPPLLSELDSVASFLTPIRACLTRFETSLDAAHLRATLLRHLRT